MRDEWWERVQSVLVAGDWYDVHDVFAHEHGETRWITGNLTGPTERAAGDELISFPVAAIQGVQR